MSLGSDRGEPRRLEREPGPMGVSPKVESRLRGVSSESIIL